VLRALSFSAAHTPLSALRRLGLSRNWGGLRSGQALAGRRNQQGIGRLEELVLETVWLKHDAHLHTLGALTRRLGHVALLDPGNRSLRGTVQKGVVKPEGGFSDGYEAHSAGSLCCTPSLAPFR
jgi:hypothetical protein